jgi:co-chaperonin GroES (HSP10)
VTTTPAALGNPVTATEEISQTKRIIKPLGDQIIIRTLPPDQIGSIIVPQSAKGISKTGTTKESNHAGQLQYVNRQLFEDLAECFARLIKGVPILDGDKAFLKELNREAQKAVLPREMKTMMEEATEPLHFVEAEVIACGPGKRGRDENLVADMAFCLRRLRAGVPAAHSVHDFDGLLARAKDPNAIQPLSVKPGDRILYHPAVQKYDREIEPELVGLEPIVGSKCFIIREESILGVVERS